MCGSGRRGAQRVSAKSLLGISYARFGFDLASGAAAAAVERVRELPHVDLAGLHVHEGSHYRSAAPFIRQFRRVFPLAQTIAARQSGGLRFLNLGGGFGVERVKPYGAWDLVWNTLRRAAGAAVEYRPLAQWMDMDALGREVVADVTSAFERARLPLPTLVFEPGRFVSGDAFVLVCRVLLRKSVPGSGTWLVLDAGTNVIPMILGFTEHHQVAPVRAPTDSGTEVVHLAGPLMYSSDVVMKNCRLPRLEAGALVAILDVGAYTLAYSNQFLYPRPAAVLVEADGDRLIRTAETYDTVLSHDRLGSSERTPLADR